MRILAHGKRPTHTGLTNGLVGSGGHCPERIGTRMAESPIAEAMLAILPTPLRNCVRRDEGPLQPLLGGHKPSDIKLPAFPCRGHSPCKRGCEWPACWLARFAG